MYTWTPIFRHDHSSWICSFCAWQAYLSILYLRTPETFQIILRGRLVENHNLANDLKFQEFILYRPQSGGCVEVVWACCKNFPAKLIPLLHPIRYWMFTFNQGMSIVKHESLALIVSCKSANYCYCLW